MTPATSNYRTPSCQKEMLIPDNEDDRLATLACYRMLTADQEEEFDDLTALAAYICSAPVALISIVEYDYQWFKSSHGVTSPIPKERETSFCAHAILQPQDVFVVPDATQDGRFQNNPMVAGVPNIRFYAGAPLLAPDGLPLGTICVIDYAPRQLTDEQLKALQRLSRQTVAQMELRRHLKTLEKEQRKVNALLTNILPRPVAEQLKQNPGLIAHSHENTTILFADLVDFTSLASQLSAEHVVRLLNQVFSLFDALTEEHGLEKIKTIGDGYMVAAGIPVPRVDHAHAIADFAIRMHQTLDAFNNKSGYDLHLRVGINTGSVVGGVIGTKKFIYDIWGDAVNVASRMEAYGVADQIHVSDPAYQLLKNDYHFEALAPIMVRGKGYMQTYLLRGENCTELPLK